MVKCGQCERTVGATDRRTCSLCLQAYHLKCVTTSGSPKDKDKNTDSWKCPKCRTAADPPLSATSTPDLQKNITNQLAELRTYFDSKLDAVRESLVKDLTAKMKAIESSVTLMGQQHKIMLDKIKNVEDSIAECTKKQKSQEKEINDLRKEVTECRSTISTLEKEKNSMTLQLSEFDSIKQNLNDVEQRARLNNLEIFGVPERKAEDLRTLMAKISTTVGVSATDDDFEYVTRVPSRNKSGLPKTIVAKFKSAQLKDTVLSAARKRRGLTSNELGITGNSVKIYVNEHLTPTNKTLLKDARLKCKELGFSHIWTRNAKIYVRKHDKSNSFRIYSIEQVKKLGN